MTDGFVLRYDALELGGEWYYLFSGDHDWELEKVGSMFVLDYLFEDGQGSQRSMHQSLHAK